MSPPLKVLLWSPAGAGSHYNGAAMNVARLYEGLPADRVEAHLVHACGRQGRNRRFTSQLGLGDIDRNDVLSILRFLVRARRWLGRHAGRFDIFHGNNILQPTFQPACWAQNAGLPVLVRPANEGIGMRGGRLLSRLLGLPARRRRRMRGFDGVIAISAEIRDELRTAGVPDERIHHIPNAVDTDRFQPAGPAQRRGRREALGLPPDVPVVLFAGKLGEKKRPAWLVHALARQPGLATAVAVLAGPFESPAFEADFRALVNASGVRNRVRLIGLQEDMPPWYQTADVFVLPSRNEGMPNALLEAAASGLPAVVTPASGVREIVGANEAGIVVESMDPFGEALARLVADPARLCEIGAVARRRTLERFSLEACVKAHLSLFGDIAARAGRPATT